MANFIHSRDYFENGNVVRLNCDTQCNFMLLDDTNFRYYKSGQACKYFGGHFKMFPAKIAVPSSGYWNVVIDLGGGSANIKYALDVLK